MADSPGVRVPPPLYVLAVFLAGYPLRRFAPLELDRAMEIGASMTLVSMVIILWGMATMLRARTNIHPSQPANALVTTGPFRWSRNPLYIGLIIGYTGAAIWTGSLPSLLLLPAAIAVLWIVVIRREEAYLERRFGDDYRDYRRRVRRWI